MPDVPDIRTEFTNAVFAAFVVLIITLSTGHTALLGMAYLEGRLITPWH